MGDLYRGQMFRSVLKRFFKKKKTKSGTEEQEIAAVSEVQLNLQLALEAGDLILTDYIIAETAFYIRSYSSQMRHIEGDRVSMEENLKLLHPEERERYTRLFNSLIHGDLEHLSERFRFHNQDGTYHYYECCAKVKKSGTEIRAVTTIMKDVSEEVLGKRIIEESNQKMRYAIRATNTVFFELDIETGMLKSYNEPLNGYDDEVPLSLDYYIDVTHPDDRKKVEDVLARIVTSGEEQVTIDIRQQTGVDEEWHYCTVSFVPFAFRQDGTVQKCVGLRRDNSRQIKYQRLLEEYKTKMDLAINGSGVMLWDYDCLSNRYIRKMDGSQECSSLEEHCNRLSQYQPEKIGPIYRMLSERRNESFRVNIKDFNEQKQQWEYFTIMGIPFLVDENNRCLKYTGYRLNTTEWHALNENLENTNLLLNTVIDKLPCGLFIKDVDNDFRYTVANKSLMDLCRDQTGEMVGKNDTEIFGPEYGQVCRISDQEAVSKGIYTNQEEVNFGDKHYVMHTSKFVIHTVSGGTLLIGISLDITSLDKTLKELQVEKQKAQEADKLKSAFLANMSHEIRTPLNAIIGFSELLQTTDNMKEREEYMGIINQNNDLLLRLISDILDLSKIESGMLEFKVAQFDLSTVFEDIYASMKPRCVNPEVELLKSNPYERCLVALDKDRLVQVETNFITNAVKHTAKGHILMGYEYVSGGIRVYVQDTGVGIAKEMQQRAFERFEKLDNFTQGTGLGLAICKAIVEANGGKIGVDSEEGKGSTFWAWFPCSAEIIETEKDMDNEQNKENVMPKPEEQVPDRLQSILIAEDNDSNYLLIKTILRKLDLTRAVNGVEAVTFASQHKYDAILMDIRMPLMDGLEATRKIREFDKDVLIIAVTANAFDTDRIQALDAGCNSFIAKPLRKAELENILKRT